MIAALVEGILLLFNAAIPQSFHLDVLTCGSLPGIAEELSTEDGTDLIAPCKDPAWTMQSILKALAQANTSQRVDLDWQAQNKVPAATYSHPYHVHTSGNCKHTEKSTTPDSVMHMSWLASDISPYLRCDGTSTFVLGN